MAFCVACPGCGTHLHLDPRQGGQAATCPDCGVTMRLPQAEARLVRSDRAYPIMVTASTLLAICAVLLVLLLAVHGAAAVLQRNTVLGYYTNSLAALSGQCRAPFVLLGLAAVLGVTALSAHVWGAARR